MVDSIDKGRIYDLTMKINNCLHKEFGVKNLNHRMIFTACALVAVKEGAILHKGTEYSLFHQTILNQLSKSLKDAKKQNEKLDLLCDVYSEIKMNTTDNQQAMGKYTEAGTINRNNQRNNGKTNLPGTDNEQWFYEMECLNCGHKYHANGSDIFQRKCPKCQGGRP